MPFRPHRPEPVPRPAQPRRPRGAALRAGVLAALTGGVLALTSACTATSAPGSGSAAGSSTPATPPSAGSPSAGASGTASGGASGGASGSVSSSASPSPSATGRPVHVSLFQGDGQTLGVGFAIIAEFDRAPTSSRAFTAATSVTVDGRPAGGAWFWQRSIIPGAAIEAIYRPRGLWPAHASIHADLPLKGLSAGPGLVYDDSLTLSVRTGARHVSIVNDATHEMTVTSDGKVVRRMPVSLGSAAHPTYRGVKVVMAKGENVPGTNHLRPNGAVRMVSTEPGDRYDLLVPWSVRVTNSGEYVHSASWNTGNIGSRDTSHGCTNLDVGAARWFWNFSLVGDVVRYPTADGPVQPSWDGWGWWNLPWSTWSRGGLLLTH